MADTIPNSFVQLYDASVKAAYQREGSLLRKTIRQRSQVGAKVIFFPTIGKGQVTTKGRNADIIPMDIQTGNASATMTDAYAPEILDALDEMKINWSIRTEYANASAMSLGRQTDQFILNALSATPVGNQTSAVTVNGGGNTSLTKLVSTTLSQRLNERDVPMDDRRWAIITPQTLNELLQVLEATNQFYVAEKILVTAKAPVFWAGFNWMVHTGLPATFNGAVLKGFFYHEQSAGLGISADIRTSIDWVPMKVAYLVNSWMSMGATVIDPAGVQVLTV